MKKIVLAIFFITLSFSVRAEESTSSLQKKHIFDNLKEEYKIVSYFLSSNQRKYYKKLDKENRWEYISAFWAAQDPNPATGENEFLSEIKARIAYCNDQFSHFGNGWETDIGRIYIIHGKPFEILKLNTGTGTKFARKEYQIWKYRISNYKTYIFIDLHQTGSYRLIYSEGDDNEGSWADWRSYLGTSFNESLLQ